MLERVIADSLEFVVTDDAFEGDALDERLYFDDFEVIGKGEALEGVAHLERALANSLEVFVADDVFEAGAIG